VDIDVEQLKQDWCGRRFDEVRFQVDAREMVEFAQACGETEPRYTDPSHPDFQAPPSYTSRFHGRRAMPEDFPIQSQQGFDAGKCVYVHGPLRPGDTVTARSEIHDIYTKTGRSGSMLFIVHRMTFTNQDDELIAVVDWRLVQNQASRALPEEAEPS
jgi:N-terminal half of MaoC dehydratase